MATDKYRELVKEYRKLAKRADQRLLRLENYAKETGYHGILQFAYRRAKRDIRSWSGESERPRFNTKPPSNTNSLKAKIADIKKFLESATSTLRPTKESEGVLSVYKRRADTINEKYGTDFTWETMAKFFDSGINKKLDAELDSDTKMESVAVIQQNKDQITNAIKNNEDVHITVEDPVVEFEVNRILEDYGLKDISQLFK